MSLETAHEPQRPAPRASSVAASGPLALGWRIGRIFGVELVLHWSLVFIVGLVAVDLGRGTLPGWHATWSGTLIWAVAVAAALLLVASIALHELAHAWVGGRMGMPVDRITLFVFGGMSRTRRIPAAPRAELLTALAGPITSVLIGLVSLVGAWLLIGPAWLGRVDDPRLVLMGAGPVATLLLWLGPINLVLAIFNLLPGFPLDGGRVLRAILWRTTGDITRATRWAAAVGSGFGWTLVGLGALMALGLDLGPLGRGPVSGLWFMLIGWFLNIAARSSYQAVLVRDALGDVSVARVMRQDELTVPPAMTVEQLVNDAFLRHEARAYLVTQDGVLRGQVALEDVRRVPRAEWASRRVDEIMTPVGELAALSPDATAFEALEVLARRGVEQAPVVDRQGVARGMVSRQDLLRWMWVASDAAHAPA